MLFASVLALVGCGDDVDPQIEAPTNVSIENGVVSWDAVTDITGYNVFVGTTKYDVSTTSFDLKTLNLPVGTHQVTVTSVKDSKVSLPSSTVNYVVASEETLSTPTNLAITDGVFSWDQVVGATGYVVVINQTEYNVTTSSYDLKSILLIPGNHSVKVKAVKGLIETDFSIALSYTVVANADKDTIYCAILIIMDSTYVPNMQLSDFTEDYEYYNYLDDCDIADTFSEAAVNAGLTESVAIDLFSHVSSISDRINLIDSAVALKSELGSYDDFGLTSDQISYIMLEMLILSLEKGHEGALEDKVYFEENITELEDSIATHLNSVEYTNLYNKFSSYADAANKVLLDEYLLIDTSKWYGTYNNIYLIAEDLLYDYNNPWYLEYDDEYTTMFYSILLAAKNANDTDFLTNLASNSNSELLPFNTLFGLNNDLYWQREFLEENTREIQHFVDIQAVISANKQVYLESIKNTYDYYINLYNNVPLTIYTTIDTLGNQAEITPAEIIALKDEIVTVLQDTLPPSEDIADLYLTFMYTSSVFVDYEVSDYLIHASTLGEKDRILIELMLTLLADIDQTMVDEISTIVDGMVIPGEYIEIDPGNGYYEDDKVDHEKVIELIVYIASYLDTFKTENEEKINELEALQLDEVFVDFIDVYADAIKAQMQIEMTQEDYELASWAVDLIVEELPNIEAAITILKSIGDNIYTEFLQTEGQFFVDYINFIIASEDSVGLLLAGQDNLFDLFIDYNNGIMNELDLASIQTLLRAVKIPVMIQLNAEDIMTPEDFTTVFNQILNPVSTIILNTITLEKAFVTAIEAIEIENSSNTWPLTNDDDFKAILILAFDQTLTTANEALVFQNIDLIADDILKNSIIIQKTGMTVSEIDSESDRIAGVLTDMFAEIHVIADYNFSGLTTEQLTQLKAFLDTNPFYQEEPITIN